MSRTRALISPILLSHFFCGFLRTLLSAALDTGLYAQGRANEMDHPISGKDERTGSVDTATERDGHVFPGIQVRKQRALLILEP